MNPSVYYNEIDPYCAKWLANLMDAGLIPRGDIDTRSIEDVIPSELAGYDQCHFFAGLGGWAYALQLAGWGTRPVWTGSCPCQPFSAAGKGAGFADERHLWPAWQHLIAQCRPTVVFGEQVASKDADAWIDLVHADMEGMGYAFGCIPFPAAGIGAPHIRDRNYWVADTTDQRFDGWRPSETSDGRYAPRIEPQRLCHVGRVADAARSGWREEHADGGRCGFGDSAQGHAAGLVYGGSDCRLADADGRHSGAERQQRCGEQRQQPQDGGAGGVADSEQRRGGCQASSADHQQPQADGPADQRGGYRGAPMQRPGPTNGLWRAADWLACTDGKWRPVEPGTFPLASRLPNRVGRLRAYGNAIVPQAAQAFITAYMQARGLIADQQAVAA